jgi:hypothetical protein
VVGAQLGLQVDFARVALRHLGWAHRASSRRRPSADSIRGDSGTDVGIVEAISSSQSTSSRLGSTTPPRCAASVARAAASRRPNSPEFMRTHISGRSVGSGAGCREPCGERRPWRRALPNLRGAPPLRVGGLQPTRWTGSVPSARYFRVATRSPGHCPHAMIRLWRHEDAGLLIAAHSHCQGQRRPGDPDPAYS